MQINNQYNNGGCGGGCLQLIGLAVVILFVIAICGGIG